MQARYTACWSARHAMFATWGMGRVGEIEIRAPGSIGKGISERGATGDGK